MTVQGKIIAITGASSGIGEATARRLASEGAKLVLGARRNDRLQAIANEIQQAGGVAVYQLLDVTSKESVKAFVDFAVKEYGRLDVLVNNAGVMPLSFMAEGKIDEWEQMVDVNIKGTLFGIGAALPVFKAQATGHFVNVTSGADRVVGPTAAVYSGTKFAVRAISEGLRMEVGDTIRVTVVAPGPTATDLAESISDPTLKSAVKEQTFANTIPADAIARAISYAVAEPENTTVRDIFIGPSSASI
jgi:NADP-dependent 3-hydroxy acid dehydrogenase YdfG